VNASRRGWQSECTRALQLRSLHANFCADERVIERKKNYQIAQNKKRKKKPQAANLLELGPDLMTTEEHFQSTGVLKNARCLKRYIPLNLRRSVIKQPIFFVENIFRSELSCIVTLFNRNLIKPIKVSLDMNF
jgi:hypothetical protein